MLDVYDQNGNWLGIAERKEVHAKGLWHRTAHCWLVRRDSRQDNGAIRDHATILFQQRSDHKDTNPGCFDITAAGHLEAGEAPKDIVRELEEELGIRVPFEQLSEFGTIREQESGIVKGIPYIDAEVSHVFGLVTSMVLKDFRLQAEELSGLYEADAEELIALMQGTVNEVKANGIELREGELQVTAKVIRSSSFVSRDPEYYISVFRFLRDLVKA